MLLCEIDVGLAMASAALANSYKYRFQPVPC